jgi:hypothetical protein
VIVDLALGQTHLEQVRMVLSLPRIIGMVLSVLCVGSSALGDNTVPNDAYKKWTALLKSGAVFGQYSDLYVDRAMALKSRPLVAASVAAIRKDDDDSVELAARALFLAANIEYQAELSESAQRTEHASWVLTYSQQLRALLRSRYPKKPPALDLVAQWQRAMLLLSAIEKDSRQDLPAAIETLEKRVQDAIFEEFSPETSNSPTGANATLMRGVSDAFDACRTLAKLATTIRIQAGLALKDFYGDPPGSRASNDTRSFIKLSRDEFIDLKFDQADPERVQPFVKKLVSEVSGGSMDGTVADLDTVRRLVEIPAATTLLDHRLPSKSEVAHIKNEDFPESIKNGYALKAFQEKVAFIYDKPSPLTSESMAKQWAAVLAASTPKIHVPKALDLNFDPDAADNSLELPVSWETFDKQQSGQSHASAEFLALKAELKELGVLDAESKPVVDQADGLTKQLATALACMMRGQKSLETKKSVAANMLKQWRLKWLRENALERSAWFRDVSSKAPARTPNQK